METIKNPDKKGYYGKFGGSFIPEILYPNIRELQDNYQNIIDSPAFQKTYQQLLTDYVGRPTPLYYVSRLSEKYGYQIYLKREDLNHTGAHKINNAIGQVLLAEQLGKQKIIAETGAGQHGVATATACALRGFECKVFMGEVDIERQASNVAKMQMLGAEVIPVKSGNRTLKDAINEAIRYWVNNPAESHYVIGSVVGPHPYPDMVTQFQSVISREITHQLEKKAEMSSPDYLLACVGGGSNSAGAFYHFLDKNVKLFGAEAAGKGVGTGETAATIALGDSGIIHGSRTMLMQDAFGQITEPYSISAGLDYPGVGPIHAYLNKTGRCSFFPVTDSEAIHAAQELARTEGIIPALESAHAFALLNKYNFEKNAVIVINLSGSGDKDSETYKRVLK